MPILVQIALRNLVQAKRRSLLLGLAIALVTMMLVLLTSMSNGISDNLVEAATTMSAGHVNVAGFYKPTAGTALPILTDMAGVKKVVEANTPGLDYIVERHRGWGKIVSETGAIQAGISGLVPTEETRFFDKLQLARESDYVDGGRDEVVGDPRQLSEPNTVVLFADQARRLGVRVGDVVTITTETSSGQTNTADVRVVAVARDLGLLSSFAVFVPKQVILDLYRLNDDTTGALWVYLQDIDQAEPTMGVIRKALADAGYTVRDHDGVPFFFKFETVQGEDWTGQQIDVTIWRDEVSFLTWIITGFNTLAWLLIGVLTLIIAIGITNSMWNAVRERTREVGALRSIGMSRSRVLQMFLFEAFFLGLFATGVGAAAGAALALLVDAAHIVVPSRGAQVVLLSDTVRLSIDGASLVAAVVVLTFVATLAALWPAIRAARLRPVEALAHVE